MSITRINTNTDALLAGANLSKMQFDLSRTLSHLSTGLRIVTGSDDPAGTGLSATFKAQLGGISVAIQNAQDGLSMMGLADAALTSNMDVLLRMRDIAVRGASTATITTAQRVTMETEFANLKTEMSTRAAAIRFNGKVLFDGSLSSRIIQIGPDAVAGNKLSIVMRRVSATNINGITGTPGPSLANAHVSGTTAASAINWVQSGINALSNLQTIIGSQERMLERMVNDLNTEHTNIAAASSRITDADMATEISNFAKQQIVAQAAAAMVAQANAMPGSIMKTLGIT